MYIRMRSSTADFFRITGQTCLLILLVLAGTIADAAPKKQIKIEQFSLNRSVAYLGEEIKATVTVSTPLPLRKKNLRLRYYLDKKEIGRQTISKFDPAGNASTVFSFQDAAEGRYNFRVVLDIEGSKTGTVEVSRQLAILSLPAGMTSHTTASGSEKKTISGKTAAGQAELSAEEISFDIPSPRVGEKVRIRTRVSNSGTVQADNVKIRLFINGQPYGDDVTMNIAAGSQVDVDTAFKASRQGKKDVLVLINPDGEIDEKYNRNNLLSKILIVRPASKGKSSTGKASSRKEKGKQANLVIYIETISGAHYTHDGKVRFYITNNSKTVPAGPFTLGIQRLEDKQKNTWLIRQPVKSLKPGATRTIPVKWPENQLASSALYVATVDIDKKINESDTRDNHSRPFRVLSTSPVAATQPPPAVKSKRQRPEILITSPRNRARLIGDEKLIVNWKSRGDIGNQVHITVINTLKEETVFSSTGNNDGAFSADLSSLAEGEYQLIITSKDRSVSSKKRVFQLVSPKPKEIPALKSPLNGSSFRGDQQLKVAWPDIIKKSSGLQLDLILLEDSSKNTIKLNNNPVAASKGEFFWQIPDDGTVFGVYKLQVRSASGRILAVTNEIELLPNFVSFEKLQTKGNKQEISVDLEIARTSFRGQNLEFLIMNNGPANISASGLYGYSFTSYFVRKLPITSDEDLVVCNSNLITELPQGEGQVISLGRDPDCPLGERDIGSKFVYVVNRFTLPAFEKLYLIDPKPLNNVSKFYWPE